ncbi:VWA domain-containing protein, partial [bacterium]|nr:VWA domain-containing protein [bacterium]
NFKKLAILLLLIFFIGCDGLSSSDFASAGVTPGGVQDNGYFRELINYGEIPNEEFITFEGFFSEHDFNVEIESCDKLICISPTLSVVKHEGQNDRYFAQLFMGSEIDLSKYQRPATDLMVILDISGSMSGDSIQKARIALKEVVDKMNSDDRFGIILFDDQYEVFYQLQKIENKEYLKNRIDEIETRGGTDIESALSKGYEILSNLESDKNKRVLLITDAMPNINATGEGEFTNLIKNYENSIGITIFGVGIDFGFQLSKAISETVGGNFIYIESGEQMVEKIRDDFELLLAPIATNFEVTLMGKGDFNIVNTFGLPSIENESIILKAKSLFLSNSKGAMAIELSYTPRNDEYTVPMNLDDMLFITWGYNYNSNSERESDGGMIQFRTPTKNNNAYYYSVDGSEKISILIEIVESFKKSINQYYNGDINESKETLTQSIDSFKTVNLILNDTQITEEITLMEKLLENINVRHSF